MTNDSMSNDSTTNGNGRNEMDREARLTAYALGEEGELDANEREEVERLLREDPEARAVVEEMRALGALVTQELGGEVAPALTGVHRARIEAAAGRETAPVTPAAAEPRPWVLRHPLRPILVSAAAAAGFVGILYVTGTLTGWFDDPGTFSFGYSVLPGGSDGEIFVADAMLPELNSLGYDGGSPFLDGDDTDNFYGVPHSLRRMGYAGVGTKDDSQAVGDHGGNRPTNAPVTVTGAPGQATTEVAVQGSILIPPLSPGESTFSRTGTPETSLVDVLGLSGGANAAWEDGELTMGFVATSDPDLTAVPTGGFRPTGTGEGGNGTVAGQASGLQEGEYLFGYATSVADTITTPLLLYAGDGKSGGLPAGIDRDEFVERELRLVMARFGNDEAEWKKDRTEYEKRMKVLKERIGTRYDELTKPRPRRDAPGTEAYDAIHENHFRPVAVDPRSTFSIDVDTASYANVRRFLRQGQLPPRDAVRIEEMINYFDYAYEGPGSEHPFATHVEVASAPWAPAHRLVRIGLQGKQADRREPKARNLVFLLDVSGSMGDNDKLPLVKKALRLLVAQLTEDDKIAIVTYAGTSGLALPPTRGHDKATILQAIESLHAGGSTNGGSGIELAYRHAAAGFVEGGVNRVLLATDGDFNVGVTDRHDLIDLIEAKAKTGVFLSVLGFGQGNLKDSQMEQLADKGNGNYSYIDSLSEARKVLVHDLVGTLQTIAKDVKIQIEFNPRFVQAYRLIGYENRVLAHRDFNDDQKDAGEIGAGHTVTALYEIVPVGVAMEGVADLKYQQPAAPPTELSEAAYSEEMLTVKLRYRRPDEDVSTLLEVPVVDGDASFDEASTDFRFAAAVASFGMLLRGSRYSGASTLELVYALARPGAAHDPHGYRQEFLRLVDAAVQATDDGRLRQRR